MSIQPRRPMLAALHETLRKLEGSSARGTAELLDLERILRRRIADLEAMQRAVRSSKRSGVQY